MVKMGNYNRMGSCEQTRGIDNLLTKYRSDNVEIINLMKTDPNQLIETIWTKKSIFGIDTRCECQLGENKLRSKYSCAQCINLERIVDFKKGVVNKEFTMECGMNAGDKLIVKKYPLSRCYLLWDNDASQKSKLYAAQYPRILQCGTDIVIRNETIKGDNFTIGTIINLGIQDFFKHEYLPHIQNLYTSFICKDKGYSLYESPSIGNITMLNLTTNTVRSIIEQLLVSFITLSKLNFSHGNPKLTSILFDGKPFSYKYQGKHIKGDVTLKLSDFSNSSATFSEIHYYPKNYALDMNLENGVFKPEIVTNVDNNDELFYRLTSTTIDIYNTLRHIGFPLYVGSFDFYCFMISLMCYNPFYDHIREDKFLSKIWTMMWLQDDLYQLDIILTNIHQNKTSGIPNPVDIIRGFWLRCDVLNHIWSMF